MRPIYRWGIFIDGGCVQYLNHTVTANGVCYIILFELLA